MLRLMQWIVVLSGVSILVVFGGQEVMADDEAEPCYVFNDGNYSNSPKSLYYLQCNQKSHVLIEKGSLLTISPNGQWMIFVEYDRHDKYLGYILVTLDGFHQRIDADFNGRQLQWTPDSQWLLSSYGGIGDPHLAWFHPSTNQYNPLSFPSGRQVGIGGYLDGSFLINLDGIVYSIQAGSQEYVFYHKGYILKIFPDWLIFNFDETTEFVQPDTLETHCVTKHLYMVGYSSVQAGYLIYWDEVNSRFTKFNILKCQEDFSFDPYISLISPDGRFIAWSDSEAGRNLTMSHIGEEGLNSDVVFDHLNDNWSFITWTEDSQHLFYYVNYIKYGLFRVSFDGSEKVQIKSWDHPIYAVPRMSEDNHPNLFIADSLTEGHLEIISLETGQVTTVYPVTPSAALVAIVNYKLD